MSRYPKITYLHAVNQRILVLLDKHITSVCRACYYHLRDLRRIRKYLSTDTAIMVANAMVSSRLDYCNSLLYGVSKLNIAKLQRVQNALYHVVLDLIE